MRRQEIRELRGGKLLMKIGMWLSYIAVRLALFLLRLLPFGAATAIAVGIARLVFRLDRRHREITLTNLRLAFPEKDDAWRWRVARASFENYGRLAVELANLHLWTPENIHDYVTFENYEIYEKAKAKGRGLFYLTAHFGNWELAAQVQALFGQPAHMVTRPLDNPYLDDYLERKRTSNGNQVLDKRNALKAMVASLRRNESVAILADQYSRRSKSVFVPLFGVLASTTAGVAVMALRTRAPIVPAFLLREPGKMRFRGVVLPEIELPDSGDRKEDIRLTTARINQAFEQIIRRQPDHWLWGHRRWKKSPDIAGNLYQGGKVIRRNGEPVAEEAA
jgi:KDO2-lipid IV(A) lauroyltransferase